jgi:hypothetical protein
LGDLEAYQQDITDVVRPARSESGLREKSKLWLTRSVRSTAGNWLEWTLTCLPPEGSPRKDALLDSCRGFFAQLDHYDVFDIRKSEHLDSRVQVTRAAEPARLLGSAVTPRPE